MNSTNEDSGAAVESGIAHFHQMHDRPRIFEHDATRIFQVDRSLNGVVGKLQEAEFSRLSVQFVRIERKWQSLSGSEALSIGRTVHAIIEPIEQATRFGWPLRRTYRIQSSTFRSALSP